MSRHLPQKSVARVTTPRWVSYGFLLITTICWGASLIVVKPALEFTTPFRFLLYRYAIASVLSLGFIWHYWPSIKRKFHTLHTITKLELLGLTLTLALLYQGLDLTSATEAALITTTTPLFITLGGIWFLHEKEEKHEWFGLITALIATLFLTLWPLWHQGGLGQTFSLAGNLLIVGQNITTAAYFILAKKYYQNWPKLFVASISFIVGLVSFLGLSLYEVGWQPVVLWQTILADWQHQAVWLASGYMAVFGSIFGLTAYIKGQAGVEASEASIFWYLEPLVYLPLGYFMLGEQIQPFQITALTLILMGVAIAEWHRQRRSSAKQTKPSKSRK